MKHDWQSLPSKTLGDWEHIPGKPAALVRTKRLPQGYLWQFGRQCGWAESVREAKDWVEALREVWPRTIR